MPGAGGITAAKNVLSAAPDGYTLGLVTNGTAISAAIFNKLPFDPASDFAMISTLGTFDLVFAVNAASPTRPSPTSLRPPRRRPASSTSAP